MHGWRPIEEVVKDMKPIPTPCRDWYMKLRQERRAQGLCVVCGKPVSDRRFEKCDGCRKVTVEMYLEVMGHPNAQDRVPWAGEAIREAVEGTPPAAQGSADAV